MRIACWISKATHTHTHTHYVIFIAFPLQEWLHERTSMLRYTYIVCLVSSVGVWIGTLREAGIVLNDTDQ